MRLLTFAFRQLTSQDAARRNAALAAAEIAIRRRQSEEADAFLAAHLLERVAEEERPKQLA